MPAFFYLMLLCLLLSGCSSPTPRVALLQPSVAELAGLRRFALQPAQPLPDEQVPDTLRTAQLEGLLRKGLQARGYEAGPPPQLRVAYWLTLTQQPLSYNVDPPAALALGPYQAIHRLQDETGTLRLRLTDVHDRVLWEGLVSTGLSPSTQSAEAMERAVEALLLQLPKAR
ncbi:MAG: DUF4136 domain-containing protein [Pseudomonadota bacterium]